MEVLCLVSQLLRAARCELFGKELCGTWPHYHWTLAAPTQHSQTYLIYLLLYDCCSLQFVTQIWKNFTCNTHCYNILLNIVNNSGLMAKTHKHTYIIDPVLKLQLWRIVHWMFRFTAFTSVFTIHKINNSSEFPNTDWFNFREPDNVTEMFSLELNPVLRVSSSRHVMF